MENQFDYVAPGVQTKNNEANIKENKPVGSNSALYDYLNKLLKHMLDKKGSDMFITEGFPPAMKLYGEMTAITKDPLTLEQAESFVKVVMNEKQWSDFKNTREANFAISRDGIGRFRVNAFMQQGKIGMIMRIINTEIPNIDNLKVPEKLKDIILEKRGLIIIVGATGSGKSTTLAAMIGHRNKSQAGHIITIEDPIEFVHKHNKSIITQREVGTDTDSFDVALKNTLRQAPDVILIGEIRDRETMEYAIAFAETGHLCLATLHANNSNQALDRIINFFPEERRHQLLMDLSLNLKSIISQRLIPNNLKGRTPCVEILINSPYVSDLVFKGAVSEIKEAMKNGAEYGMQTFDQALFNLYEEDIISYDNALRFADSENDLRLNIKLKSKKVTEQPTENVGISLKIKEDDKK